MEINERNIKELLCKITECYEFHRDELCDLDRIVGDGDHGESMRRGTFAAMKAIEGLGEEESVYKYFSVYSRTMIAEIGGAIGPIFGTIIHEFGKASKQSGKVSALEFKNGLTNACASVMRLGGAKVGDKTLIDAIYPAQEKVNEIFTEASTLHELTKAAVGAAKKGVDSTMLLQAKKGRAKHLREKSIGYRDAGATSLYYFLATIDEFVAGDQS